MYDGAASVQRRGRDGKSTGFQTALNSVGYLGVLQLPTATEKLKFLDGVSVSTLGFLVEATSSVEPVLD